MKCSFISVADPAYRGPSDSIPAVGFCQTHQRAADVCQAVNFAAAVAYENAATLAKSFAAMHSNNAEYAEADACSRLAFAIEDRAKAKEIEK